MSRLACDFSNVAQHNGRLKILIDLRSIKEKETFQQIDLYKSEFPNSDNEYEAYRKGEGLIIRMWL